MGNMDGQAGNYAAPRELFSCGVLNQQGQGGIEQA